MRYKSDTYGVFECYTDPSSESFEKVSTTLLDNRPDIVWLSSLTVFDDGADNGYVEYSKTCRTVDAARRAIDLLRQEAAEYMPGCPTSASVDPVHLFA
jgi:hypothetical protein